MNKKIFKRAFVGFMVAAMMMTVTGGAAPKTASAATVKKSGDFRYVKCKGGVEITKYTGKAKKLDKKKIKYRSYWLQECY